MIYNELQDIENRYDIKILFSCESGSRAWGFPSPDSDYDIRFVYVHSKEYYLSVFKKADHIGLPINNELDIYGWDLSKVLQLMGKSNTTPFEWLQSPIFYKEDSLFQKELWNLCQSYFCARTNTHHYLGIARGAMESMDGNHIKIKKLFYILRPLLSALWCVEKQTIAPMTIFPLMKLLPEDLSRKVNDLIELKSAAEEGYMIEVDASLQQWMNETYRYCTEKSGLLDKKIFDLSLADHFFRRVI